MCWDSTATAWLLKEASVISNFRFKDHKHLGGGSLWTLVFRFKGKGAERIEVVHFLLGNIFPKDFLRK